MINQPLSEIIEWNNRWWWWSWRVQKEEANQNQNSSALNINLAGFDGYTRTNDDSNHRESLECSNNQEGDCTSIARIYQLKKY